MDKLRFDKFSGVVTVQLDGGAQSYPVVGSKAPEDPEALGAYLAEQLAPALGQVDTAAVSQVAGELKMRAAGGQEKTLSFSGPVGAGVLQAVREQCAAAAAGTSVTLRAKRLADEAKAREEAAKKAAEKPAAVAPNAADLLKATAEAPKAKK